MSLLQALKSRATPTLVFIALCSVASSAESAVALDSSSSTADVPAHGVVGRVLLNGQPVEGAKVTIQHASPPTNFKRGYLFLDQFRYQRFLRGFGGSADSPLTTMGKDAAGDFSQIQALSNPFAVLCRGEAEREYTTDGDGRFVRKIGSWESQILWSYGISTPIDSWFSIQVEWDNHFSKLLGPFSENGLRDRSARLMDIELLPTGSIQGFFLPALGEDPSSVVIGISRGDGICRTTSVDANGKYSFDNVPAGDWQVRTCPKSSGSDFELCADPEAAFSLIEELEWDCSVSPGRVTSFDLNLLYETPVQLSGIVALLGRDTTDWRVRVLWSDSETSLSVSGIAETILDANGGFEFQFSDPMETWIEISSPDEGFVYWTPLTLYRGSNDFALAPRMGRVALAGRWAEGFSIKWGEPKKAHGFAVEMASRESANAEFGVLPAGTLRVYSPGMGRACWSWARPDEFRLPVPMRAGWVNYESLRFKMEIELRDGESLVADVK